MDYVFVPRSGRGEQLLYPSCQTSHYAGYLRSAISLDEPWMAKGRYQFLWSTHCQHVTSIATNQISILCTSLAYLPMGKERKKGWQTFRCLNQQIGLRENLQESPTFSGKIHGFRLRFSLKPIHCLNLGGNENFGIPKTETFKSTVVID